MLKRFIERRKNARNVKKIIMTEESLMTETLQELNKKDIRLNSESIYDFAMFYLLTTLRDNETAKEANSKRKSKREIDKG